MILAPVPTLVTATRAHGDDPADARLTRHRLGNRPTRAQSFRDGGIHAPALRRERAASAGSQCAAFTGRPDSTDGAALGAYDARFLKNVTSREAATSMS